MKSLLSHALAIAVGAGVTSVALIGGIPFATVPEAEATQAQSQVAGQAQQTVLLETIMEDVLGRVVAIREFERAPGTGGTPHRHPGSHTFGYVLEGTYEVQVDDGPVQRLGPGQTFYERPNALHAVSRNGSATELVRYLVFTVSDPTLPATVQEN
jgi:quercetin dioxygenase-like cupin family protein